MGPPLRARHDAPGRANAAFTISAEPEGARRDADPADDGPGVPIGRSVDSVGCLDKRRNRAAAKDPALRAAMQDERANDVRLRAYRVAFCATVGSAGLLGVPAAGHLLTAATATTLVVIAGVASFIVAFVVLDGE
jgi:hypothetical protein